MSVGSGYIVPRVEQDASEGKGSGWLGGLSPFLRFNLTPHALRLRQLHMHMPAILFVVGDYAVIKGPVSSSVARQQNYCPPRVSSWLRKLSPGLQSPVKTQVGHFILNCNEWKYSLGDWPGSSRVTSPPDISEIAQCVSLCKAHYTTEKVKAQQDV